MLLYTEGFEHQDLASRGWTINATTFKWDLAAATRFNYGIALRIPNGNYRITRGVPASAKLIVGFALNCTRPTLSNCDIFTLMGDGSTTSHLSLRRISGSSTIALFRGNTQIAAFADVLTDMWHYVEISATISDTVGRAIVKVDGATVIDFTGDTKNAGTSTLIDGISFATGNNTSDVVVDDLYVLNDQGGVNNDFLGDRRVVTLLPNEAGFTTALQPFGNANNWDNVNELPVSATDYNSSAVVGARDMYGVENLPASVKDVNGVQVNVVGLKSDAGNAFFKPVVMSGGSTRVGASSALTTAMNTASFVQDLDPATSAPWSASGISAINIGVEVA